MKRILLVHCFVNILSLTWRKLSCILPVKCLCRDIVLFYKPQNAPGHFFNRFITTFLQQFTVDDPKPDLYLVHPGAMFRGIHKTHPMAFIHKEPFTAFHAF